MFTSSIHFAVTCRDLAVKLWAVAQLQLPSALCDELLNDVIHPVAEIQQAGAQALAALLKQETGFIDHVLEQLLAIYHEKLAVRSLLYFITVKLQKVLCGFSVVVGYNKGVNAVKK
jgi:hypothetical protein